MTSCSIVTIGLSDIAVYLGNGARYIAHRFQDKRRCPSKIANFSDPRVFNAPGEGVPLGIWYRPKGSRMII